MNYLNLDANASYSLLPEVREALSALPPRSLNPSAVHRAGQAARAMVEEAREEIGRLVGVTREERIVFTSGATEANNLAVLGAFFYRTPGASSAGAEAVTTLIEHSSVLEPFSVLAERGFKIARVAPSRHGVVEPRSILAECGEGTRFVSMMLANNETGHVYPVAETVRLVKEAYPSVCFHSDAVQALGKLPFRFSDLGVDMLSVSGHKLGALPGCGAIVARKDAPLFPILFGGTQELRFRPGTENVAGAWSFGIAARVVRENFDRRVASMRRNVEVLKATLEANAGPLRWNTPVSTALPNTLSVTFPGVRSDELIVALDLEGICVAAGAACSSGKSQPSHVLRALGLSDEEAEGTLRLSVEADSTVDDMAQAAHIIARTVLRAREARL